MKKITVCCISIFSILCLSGCSSVAKQLTQELAGPSTFSQRLAGACEDKEGTIVLLDSEYYLVYYAADWCPYCLEYTEELKRTYDLFKRMYGNVEIVFAGHERDTSNDNLLSFLNMGGYSFPYVRYEYREATGIMDLVDVPKFWVPGFVLVDRYGKVLSSSNGETLEDYSRDRPVQFYQSIQQCDCVLEGL